jgi:hypothetical protein
MSFVGISCVQLKTEQNEMETRQTRVSILIARKIHEKVGWSIYLHLIKNVNDFSAIFLGIIEFIVSLADSL